MSAGCRGAAPTVSRTLEAAVRRLRAVGVPGPRRDAGLLLAHAIGFGQAVLLGPSQAVGATEAIRFERALRRREAREPVSRILGRREFWGMDFELAPSTFDPRPDSETLVSTAVAAFSGAPPPGTILDLGTGSGCLLCALLREFPAATGFGVDIDPPALRLARANAVRLGFGGRARWLAGDWARALANDVFDLVVANPPYIARDEIARLAPEVVRHDPRRALDGGRDGLDAMRALAPQLARVAAPGAPIVMEVGAGQADQAALLLAAAGCSRPGRYRDLGGVERVVATEGARPEGPRQYDESAWKNRGLRLRCPREFPCFRARPACRRPFNGFGNSVGPWGTVRRRAAATAAERRPSPLSQAVAGGT